MINNLIDLKEEINENYEELHNEYSELVDLVCMELDSIISSEPSDSEVGNWFDNNIYSIAMIEQKLHNIYGRKELES